MKAVQQLLLLGALAAAPPLAAAAAEAEARAEAADEDVGYDLLVTSADGDVQRSCFPMGQLPAAALGTYFVSGPAKFEMGGYSFRSFFDGYGRVNRFELNQGEACFTAKFLNSSYLQHAEKAGRIANGPTFYGVEPPLPRCNHLRDPMCSITGGELDNNWVNLLPMAGPEGLLLSDSPFFLRLDYETLEVHGAYPWKDGGMMPSWLQRFHIPAMLGSAHPVLRPGTEGSYVEVMQEVALLPFGTDAVAVYHIDSKTMERKVLGHVPMKGIQYLHSFGVTEKYVVLPMNLRFSKPKNMTALLTGFVEGWDGLHVVDLEGNVQVFRDTEKFFHVHIANTFENETGIVMDLGTFSDIPFSPEILATRDFLNKTLRDDPSNFNQVERFHLHLAGDRKGQVTRQVLSPPRTKTDFFKINPARNGLPHCIYYAVEWFHKSKTQAKMAVLKHDVCEGSRLYWSRRDSYPGEPLFVPTAGGNAAIGQGAGAGEDEGLLIFVTLDGRRKASDLVVLSAKTFKELALVKLPVHIPFLAHGQFIPKAAREAVKAAVGEKQPGVAAALQEAGLVI